jgi:4-amino-4-deoxy-L-arabinose transferase-like glycosyltransferase
LPAAALVLAFAVRLVWLLGTLHLKLVNDPADYQRLAASLVAGHGFGRTVVAPGGGPTAFRPPLWPLFLAGLYLVTGAHVLAARVVEVFLGTLTVGLIGVLGRQLWGRSVAVAAMVVAAVYPGLLLGGGSLLSESLSLPLEIGSLSAAIAARRSARPRVWVLLSGLLCGLDVLCRPDSFVLLLPVVLLASGHPRRWIDGLVVVLVAVLTVTPWMVRDDLVMGRFVPVTTQGGLVASGTYNGTAAHDRRFPAQWRPPNLVPAYAPLIKGTEVQEEAALRHAALSYIGRHPLYVARVVFWNSLRLFDLTGLSDPRISWAANGYGPALATLDPVGLGLLAVLWAIGLATRRRGPSGGRWLPAGRMTAAPGRRPAAEVRVLWLAPVLLGLVTVLVLGESRLRVGLDPFLVLLAAPGARALGGWMGRR